MRISIDRLRIGWSMMGPLLPKYFGHYFRVALATFTCIAVWETLDLHRGVGDVPERVPAAARAALVGGLGDHRCSPSWSRVYGSGVTEKTDAFHRIDTDTAWHIAVVMACGFITFYPLPDILPFSGRITTMVLMQFVVG